MVASSRLVVLSVALGILAAGVPLVAGEVPSGLSWAKVYTAKVQGVGIPQGDLQQTARTQGAVEIISFPTGGNPADTTSRTLIRTGTAGIGYPGLSFDVQQGLAYAGSAGGTTALSGGATIQATLGQAVEDPLIVSCLVNGQEVIRTSVYGIVDGKLAGFIEMVTPADGATVAQVIEYLNAEPSAAEMIPVTPVPDQTASSAGHGDEEAAGGGMTYVAEDGVSFSGALTGLSWTWDSKWWPGNGENPGGFPLQVRFNVGAGADVSSHVDGNFVLSYLDSQLQAGNAAGDLAMNFGALISARGALTILWFDPIVFNIPYVPQFDMQVYDQQTFSNYLLDSSVNVADATERQNLVNLDVLSLIGGSWLPSWVTDNLDAGITIQGALTGSGAMTCQSIAFSDGTVFTTEGESRPVTLTPQGYQATATYNENLTMSGTLTLYPSLFVKLAGWINWSYPVFELPWTFFNGPADLNMSTSNVDYPPILVDLDLTTINPTYGQVTLDPVPSDPCNPQYPLGSTVTLTAVPVEGKKFLQWEIYDPNYPDDANYRVIDTNSTLVVLMDGNRDIHAVFKCGSGVGQALPLLVLGLAICSFAAWRRR
jgi:hypothetical protein